jgi:hypothetical protein
MTTIPRRRSYPFPILILILILILLSFLVFLINVLSQLGLFLFKPLYLHLITTFVGIYQCLIGVCTCLLAQGPSEWLKLFLMFSMCRRVLNFLRPSVCCSLVDSNLRRFVFGGDNDVWSMLIHFLGKYLPPMTCGVHLSI